MFNNSALGEYFSHLVGDHKQNPQTIPTDTIDDFLIYNHERYLKKHTAPFNPAI